MSRENEMIELLQKEGFSVLAKPGMRRLPKTNFALRPKAGRARTGGGGLVQPEGPNRRGRLKGA